MCFSKTKLCCSTSWTNHPLEGIVKRSSIPNEMDITPKIGMEFDLEDEAYLYYNICAGYVGFSIH